MSKLIRTLTVGGRAYPGTTHFNNAAVNLASHLHLIAVCGTEPGSLVEKSQRIATGAAGALFMADMVDQIDAFKWRAEYRRKARSRKQAFELGLRAGLNVVADLIATQMCTCEECAAERVAAEFESVEFEHFLNNKDDDNDDGDGE